LRKGCESATDFVLGRLVPSEFPSVFGPNADQPLDAESSLRKFKDLATEINKDLPAESRYTVDQVAAGYIKVASEPLPTQLSTIIRLTVSIR
jgi:5-oxoprolinase (ATP-hydrolysing)